METNKNQGQVLVDRLLHAFTTGTDDVLRLFAEEAIVEYPYAPSLGGMARLTKADYRQHLEGILPQMPTILFSNVRVYPLQQEGAYWAEFHGETTIPATGKLYQQDYVVYLTISHDQFSTYREYWNPLLVVQSFDNTTNSPKAIDPLPN